MRSNACFGAAISLNLFRLKYGAKLMVLKKKGLVFDRYCEV